ncbi:MAG: Flp family type IVb pilin [Kiloniellaceae bacterium]
MLDVLNWIGEDESGTAAIEYGLIAALVSVAAITALAFAGGTLDLLLNLVVEALLPPG